MANRKVFIDGWSRNRPVVNPSGVALARGVGCVASERCDGDPVPDAPVQLCGKHLREVYQFAQDMVARNWDPAMRDYVASLQDRFRPPVQMTRRPRPGHVYFIRLGDRVKVGYSETPDRRLAALPHEEVLGIVPGTRDDERAWHALLAPFRVVGEWFRAEPEVLNAIGRVCKIA